MNLNINKWFNSLHK